MENEINDRLEYHTLIADQTMKDRMYRESVIHISQDIYMAMIRDAGPRITRANMESMSETCIEAARVFVEQVRDNP